jgi:tetratricopeptide (TPR) repeat protein
MESFAPMDLANAATPGFIDLRTRAEFLELCGDDSGAERLRNLSLQIAREVDLICYAYQLLWRAKLDDAIEILEGAAAAHPDSWNVRHSLGEAYEALGDDYSAAMNFRLAAALTEDEGSLALIETSLARVNRFQVAS